MGTQQNNHVMPFDFKGHTVRTVLINNEPWFVASDVCDVLGIGNARDAVMNLDEDEKSNVGNTDIRNIELPNRGVNVVNESGLYHLVFKSRKPEAKQFRKWVTQEVLPALRKTGTYTIGQKPTQTPHPENDGVLLLSQAVLYANRKLEEQQTVLEDQDALIKDQSALLEEQTALLEAQTTHIEEQRAVKRDLDSTVEMQRRTNWKLCRDIAKQRRVTGELCEHIEKLEPKAEYYDKMVEHGDSSTNLRITALQVKVPLGQLIQFLIEKKFIYYQNKSSKKEGFLPYSEYVAGDADKRYFEVKDFYNKRSHVHGRQTLVTMLGKQYFATAVKEWEKRRADLERQESLDMEVSIARPAGNRVNVIKQPRLAFDKLGQDYE